MLQQAVPAHAATWLLPSLSHPKLMCIEHLPVPQSVEGMKTRMRQLAANLGMPPPPQ